MRAKLDIAAHVILGLIFFVFGLNGFLNFLPMPELTGDAGSFFQGLMAAPYFLPLLKVVEVLAGVMLLFRRFVPLALILLAPIVVQIFMFHAMLAPEGLPLPIVIVLLEGYLGFNVYRDSFRTVLQARPEL